MPPTHSLVSQRAGETGAPRPESRREKREGRQMEEESGMAEEGRELRIKSSTQLNHNMGNVASVTWTFNTQHSDTMNGVRLRHFSATCAEE